MKVWLMIGFFLLMSWQAWSRWSTREERKAEREAARDAHRPKVVAQQSDTKATTPAPKSAADSWDGVSMPQRLKFKGLSGTVLRTDKGEFEYGKPCRWGLVVGYRNNFLTIEKNDKQRVSIWVDRS